MRTLLDKWNYYKGIIDAREKLYIENTVKEVPKYLYHIYNTNGDIRELEITKVGYANRQHFSVTRKDIERMRLFAETPYVFNPNENILYHYQYFMGSSKCMGAFALKDISNYTNKEKATELSKVISEKNQNEETLIANGTHTRCERCRKVVDNSRVVHFRIRSIATYGHAGRDGKFCSPDCAGNEQMAHEG